MRQFENDELFDVALALYHWLQHNWIGMDDKYEGYCKLTADGVYKPARSQEYFETLAHEDNISARIIYDELTDDNYQDYLNQVLNYKSEEN